MADTPPPPGFTLDQSQEPPPPAGFSVDNHEAAPPAETQQQLPGFSDEQKQQILAYIPHAKDAADLERFSSELTQGRSKIGNAQAVLAMRDKGHKEFGWTPPTPMKQAAPVDPGIAEHLRGAVGEGILNALDGMVPGLGMILRDHKDAGKAFTEHAANAVVGDYGPEVGGLIDTILHPGTSVGNNADHERATMEGDSAGHPIASTAGELTGVGVDAALGNEAGLANLGKGARIATTAGEGAVYGSGAAGPGNRLGGAAVGAVAAPVLGLAAKVPAALVGAGKSVMEGTPGLARRIISSAIKQDMNTPESVGATIADAQANDVPMALGDTGENMRGLLAASSRASGVGRTVVRDALEERQSQLADRITGHIERDLGPVANPHEVADNLMTEARTKAAPIYDQFYSKPPVASTAVDTLLQRPSMQKALKNAYTLAKEEGRDPEAVGLHSDESGNVSVGRDAADSIPIYRGENAGNKGGSYYSTNPDWAAQFTQGGRASEVKTASIHPDDVYVADPLPLATNEHQFDAAMSAAKSAGKKAFRVDEGAGEPNSIYVIDKAVLKGRPTSAALNAPTGPTKSYTPQTLDYIKRGMDDVVESYRDPTSGKLNLDTEGRAVNNTLRSYTGVVDKLYPDYADARAAYAGPVKGIAAMNLGRKALNMTGDDLEARMRDMSPFEKTMFAAGIRRSMAETVQAKGDTADIVNALVGTGKKRAMLARAFGDRQQFQRFVNTLGQEREGWRSFKQALLGSPTAANAQDDAALQTATIAADLMTTGLPIATSMRYALKFGVGKLGEKSKQQVAALLSNTDPAAIRELAAELRAKAEQRGVNVRRLDNVTGAIGKSGVAAIGQQEAQ